MYTLTNGSNSFTCSPRHTGETCKDTRNYEKNILSIILQRTSAVFSNSGRRSIIDMSIWVYVSSWLKSKPYRLCWQRRQVLAALLTVVLQASGCHIVDHQRDRMLVCYLKKIEKKKIISLNTYCNTFYYLKLNHNLNIVLPKGLKSISEKMNFTNHKIFFFD